MHWILLLVAFMTPALAQPTLFACGSFSQQYVVGAKLPPSGLFRKNANGQWEHLGYNHPFLFGLAGDSQHPDTLYLAAGNGVIRAEAGGTKWTILTGSDITEVRNVVAGPGFLAYGYSHGIRVSRDGGKTWQELASSLRRKYTGALYGNADSLIAGTEEGLWRTEDAGKTWRQVGAAGYQVMRIENSPHDACHWLASTEQGGLFESRDCGKTFESSGRLGVGQNIYDVAFDPRKLGRIAIGGWGVGVAVSEDGGKTWTRRNVGLPRPEVTTLTFDPAHAGRLYAAVHKDGVFVSDDAGGTWRKDGLGGGQIQELRFVSARSAE